MEKNGWKIIAIVFILLFAIESVIFCIGYYETAREERKAAHCFYEICAENIEAALDYGFCTCYDEIDGEYVAVKTEYLG